jgi:hypothetical protein
MSYLATSKFGNCNRCPSENTPVRKRGRELVCLSCCRKEDVEKQLSKQKDRRKVQASLSRLAKTDGNRELVRKEQSKSELLKLADKLFANFIVNRDKDKNGNIVCICCGKIFNVEQTNNPYYDKLGEKDKVNNPRGEKIVQNLHFIERGIYSLRYDEFNCHAGCTYCNFDMFHTKQGRAFKQYREFMVAQYGEEYVAEMEVAKRKINRI